jgi:hypothetical protein
MPRALEALPLTGISREHWTPTDDAILTRQQGPLGQKSSTLRPLLPGWTDVSIKNQESLGRYVPIPPTPKADRPEKQRNDSASQDPIESRDWIFEWIDTWIMISNGNHIISIIARRTI